MTSEYDIETNTQPYAEDLGIDVPMEYGVIFINRDGSEHRDTLRWTAWSGAATYGEEEVSSGAAVGFRVFSEAAV